MPKEVYVIVKNYQPNTAFTNRFLALIKGFSENGIKTKVFFIYHSNFQKVESELKDVEFIYLWENKLKCNKYFSIICSLLSLFCLLKKRIPVLIFNIKYLLLFFRLRFDVKLYYESTEHPQAVQKIHGILGNVLNYLYLFSARLLDGLFVISPALSSFYRDKGVSMDKIHIINMLVDKDRFLSVKNNINSKKISYCGTVSEYKDGVNVLINAFSKFHNKYPEYILQIIGKFENKDVELRLRNLVNSLNLRENVIFRGRISASEMPSELADSKILALARPDNLQAKYGFPTKLGEYLMTGVPVVMTNVGDIGRYLQNDKEIFLTLPGSVDDFSDKLVWVVEHYNDALKIGANGRKVAMSLFDYFVESKKMLHVLFP